MARFGNRHGPRPSTRLGASDRLASIVLSPVDQALREHDVPFVRHNDDLRIAAATLPDARSAKSLVSTALQELDLMVNTDKTRSLRRDTYMQRRTGITEAVKKYLKANNSYRRENAIYEVLEALGADDDLMWSWYHSDLGVPQVLTQVGANLGPEDGNALLVLLDGVLEEEKLRDRWTATPLDEHSYDFVLRAGVGLLATSRVAEAAHLLPTWLADRPEYTDVLSMYVELVAPKNPPAIADMLIRIETSHDLSSDAPWLRLYAALGDGGQHGEFDGLADLHIHDAKRDWLLRLRASRFMAQRGKPPSPVVESLIQQAPPALRDDVLGLVKLADPSRLSGLVKNESETTKSLVAV